MTVSALRAKCLAGGSPLERRVRQHCSWRTKPRQESEGQKHCLALLAADAPARGTGEMAAQSAAIAGNERRQSLPRGGGTTDKLKPTERATELGSREALQTERAWQMRRPWHLSIATQSLANLRRLGQRVHLVFGGDCRPATVASTFSIPWCCLTFELRG